MAEQGGMEMSVTLYGHGVYCSRCIEVYESTNDCGHNLGAKMGVQRTDDGYAAQPDGMGHYSPHVYHEVDGMDTCLECGRVKISTEMVRNDRNNDTDT